MSTRTETSGRAIRKYSAKYVGKITAEMLYSIANKIEQGDKIRFIMGNVKNSNELYINYYPRFGLNMGRGRTWEDPKPLIITMYYPDGNSVKEERQMSPSDCAIFINRLWTNKDWQCKLQFTYYERPSEMSKNNIVIDVEYRNTKYSIGGPLNKKLGVRKVKPSIRTSRMPLNTTKTITKTKDINSLNGRKTSSPKSPFSKMVGVRPTKKCNFKKLI